MARLALGSTRLGSTRSLGSYSVSKEDTLLHSGRLGGGAPGSEATANEVAQRHGKLCMDGSGVIRRGRCGGIDLFDSMLEEQVGYMDATALRGIYAASTDKRERARANFDLAKESVLFIGTQFSIRFERSRRV